MLKLIDVKIQSHPLKAKLRERGIRQVQLAKALGISHSSLAAYLNGYRVPPADIQERLKQVQKNLEQE